jgi:hypothetical protein
MVFLFLLGAAASLVGDHSHVATGTTVYFTHAVPFVWSSPVWFPAMVGLATVSLAELRMHLPDVRTSVTSRQGVGRRRCGGRRLCHHGPGAHRTRCPGLR